MEESFYNIIENNSRNEDIQFSSFVGKVVYGVNVASRCGYTKSGYELISKLSGINGVVVLIFPCNQFGAQEPGTNSEIENFCVSKGVHPSNAVIFEKADVNGPNTRPAYRYLKSAVDFGDIRWNFAGKFLVSKSGVVSKVTDENNLENDIMRLLAE